MRRALVVLSTAAVLTGQRAVAQAPLVCNGAEIATLQPYQGTASGPVGGAMYFDLTVSKPGGIRMGQIETNVASPAGTPFTLQVYARPGGWVGFENSAGSWALATTGQGISAGPDQPTLVDLMDVQVPVAPWGVCLELIGAAHAYTPGNGSNQVFTTSGVSISAGAAASAPFSGVLPTPYVWNGKLLYDCAPPLPIAFCWAGNTTMSCVPAISGSAQPSASLATPCTIRVDNVEGQKQGLLFYGIDNSGYTPNQWGTGSSVLCVRAPLQRTGVQSSGGTVLGCDGTLTLDWNAYQAAHPGALGQPFATGHKVFVQGWFRDPMASLGTNLSNALEMTMQP